MIKLSTEQANIVNAPLGPILVTATAGSGKTRVLVERVRYLLSANPLDGILALTFTNKAAEEMQLRLEDVEDLDRRAFIGTLHSFALDLIQKHGKHIGIKSLPHIFERDEDRLRILDGVIEKDAWESREARNQGVDADLGPNRKKLLYDWLNFISMAKRNLLTQEEIASSSDTALQVFNAYQEELRALDAVDFDDFLLLACQLLSEQPRVANHIAQIYPHVCVDEAQDLNQVQYELIRILCAGRVNSVLLVGDENQSIYGFNDSSADFMNGAFRKDFKPTCFKLVENFRSSRWVLDLANKIKPGSMEKVQAGTNGEGAFFAASSEEDEAGWVCDRISDLLEKGVHEDIEGPITLSSMVVLARNRYVFKSLQEELTNRGIDHFLKRPSGSFDLESETGKVFELLLRVLLNPSDLFHCRQLFGLIGAKQRAIQPNNLAAAILDRTLGQSHEWETRLEASVLGIQEAINSASPTMTGCTRRLRELLQQTEFISAGADEAVLAVHDLLDLGSHWDRYVSQQSAGTRVSLEGFRNTLAMGKTHSDADEHGLALSTVHTMKGLEYDVVFLIGLGNGTFPDYRAVQKGGKALVEESNNAFVAVTRAKRLLYASYPRTKKMPWGGIRSQEPSPYWLDLTG